MIDETVFKINNQDLTHFGVKGMRWGVRKSRKHNRVDSKTYKSRRSVKNLKVRKASDKDIQQAIHRLELETRYKELKRRENGDKFIDGRKLASRIVNDSLYKMGTQAMDKSVHNIAKSLSDSAARYVYYKTLFS